MYVHCKIIGDIPLVLNTLVSFELTSSSGDCVRTIHCAATDTLCTLAGLSRSMRNAVTFVVALKYSHSTTKLQCSKQVSSCVQPIAAVQYSGVMVVSCGASGLPVQKRSCDY